MCVGVIAVTPLIHIYDISEYVSIKICYNILPPYY